MNATYSPDDNKLRLYASTRLDPETYQRVKAAGFIWAPKQELFVAPMWTPQREDLLIELCGEIDDEDKSLTERAEERADRMETYAEHRADDADRARKAVSAIADNIPMGQPILVGHHSERHARRDAEKIENGMRRAVKMWKQSKYWQSRAAGAIRHAKYKELPSVRARRIKVLEVDKRKQERTKKEKEFQLKFWRGELGKKGGGFIEVNQETALWFCNSYDHASKCFPLIDYPRTPPASQYEGSMSLWSALDGGVITAEQIPAFTIPAKERVIENCNRWLTHINNRLEYERAMMQESGGIATDKTGPEKGGACKCWASPRQGWSYIEKVNKVSVTVLDNWGNGGGNFTRTIPFDKLKAIMTVAQVQEAREAGTLKETDDKTGFYLMQSREDLDKENPPKPERAEKNEPIAAPFEAMREQLALGVQVVTAPQLFPTPPDLAARMVEMAEIEPGQSILEPSAGTGSILDKCFHLNGFGWNGIPPDGQTVAVEINLTLAQHLQGTFPKAIIVNEDFLTCDLDYAFDRILMNPPFENGADIKHIEHALTMLKPGGRLVAICANGPRQQEQLQPISDIWEELPADTFKEVGTGVRTVLLTINKASPPGANRA